MAAAEVQAFGDYLASLTDQSDRDRAFAQVRMLSARDASEEALARPLGRSAADLIAETPERPDWLIPGVLARGWMVKVAAREKTGKGTLIANLLGHLEQGTASVFGPAPSEKVTALIYTEEPPESIREKVQHAGLRSAWIVYGWELAAETWEAKCLKLAAIASEGGHGVVFVDNISRAAGVEDEAGVELARAAEKLADAARSVDCSVLIDHHHRKGAGKLDDKSRGGTALAGACDNNLEMVRVGGWDSRVRKLSSRGRLSATIWERTIALRPDGKDYESVADTTQPQTLKERQRLRVLHEAEDGLTASEAAAAWACSNDTARRALEDFVSKGWASEDEDAYPTRWASTGEGLAGPVDLFSDPSDPQDPAVEGLV